MVLEWQQHAGLLLVKMVRKHGSMSGMTGKKDKT